MPHVPLPVLLDVDDPFLPSAVGTFTSGLFEEPGHFRRCFFIELELIYQQVGEGSWRELEAYIDGKQATFENDLERTAANTAWAINLFSSDVRAAWAEAFRVRISDGSRLQGLKQRSGYFLLKQRDRFIDHFNLKLPESEAPLQRTDNLTSRLELPPWNRWDVLTDGLLTLFPSGDLTDEEIAHLHGKGVHLTRIRNKSSQRYPIVLKHDSAPSDAPDPNATSSSLRPNFKVRVE